MSMARNRAFEADDRDILQRLLQERPDDRDRFQLYVRRAKAYRNECGCAMSGAFLIAAALLVVAGSLWRPGAFTGGFFFPLLADAGLVFGAAIAGKLAGIAIARLRLALLYREVRIQFAIEGD